MLETNKLRLHIICSPYFRQIRTGIPEFSTEDILGALDSHIALRPLASHWSDPETRHRRRAIV